MAAPAQRYFDSKWKLACMARQRIVRVGGWWQSDDWSVGASNQLVYAMFAKDNMLPI